jgi:HSP90 family molecular chaperone
MLEQNRIIKLIKKNITPGVLELFAEKKDDFEILYEQFSQNIRLDIHEDSANGQELARLLHFYSIQSREELTAFGEYIERMTPEQKGIDGISGETQDGIMIMQMLEYFQQKGIEVLFLIDSMNEYYFQQLKDDADHKLI